MPTCPDCGSMIMEGDPYCTHCGAHLKWNNDAESDHIPGKGKPQLITKADERKLIDVLNEVCLGITQKLQLMALIKEYLNARDCIGFWVRRDFEFDVYYFNFIQKNALIETTHVMTYLPDYANPDRAFYESYSEHRHDGLLADSRFKRLVDGMGYEFLGCEGGYELHLERTYKDVEMTDKLNVRAYFKVNGKRHRMYYLDLDNMTFDCEYYEYDGK